MPGFEEARWITSEDVNVEHLLSVFTSINMDSDGIWDACANFMAHLYWHKPRLVVLGSKIEGLPDHHPSKPRCLFHLSRLFDSVGNIRELRRLLIYALGLWRERGEKFKVTETLTFLGDANRRLGRYAEGIPQAKEALGIYNHLGRTAEQARSLQCLAELLHNNNQLSAAEDAVSRAIELLPDKGGDFDACQCYRLLGNICHSRGETEKAKNHFETALRIASSFGWDVQQIFILHSLATLFFNKGRFDDAQVHVERARAHAANNAYYLAHTMWLQTRLWYKQHRLEEARSEALRAADVYQKLGAAQDLKACRRLLRTIGEVINVPVTTG